MARKHGGKRANSKGRPGVKDKIKASSDLRRATALSKQLTKCMSLALNFVEEVFTSKETIEVSKYTKEGDVKKMTVLKYSPELKTRILEKIADKTFADKKDLSVCSNNPNALNVVSFNFTEIDPKKVKESNNG